MVACQPCRFYWAVLWITVATLWPDAAQAQLGTTLAEARQQFGLIPHVDSVEKQVLAERYACYFPQAADHASRLWFLFDGDDRLVGLADYPGFAHGGDKNVAFKAALEFCAPPARGGQATEANWELISEPAGAFPPLGHSWATVLPQMRTLHSVKYKTYDRNTGALLYQSPWMPVEKFTGRYVQYQGQDFSALAIYASTDGRSYAIASLSAARRAGGVVNLSHGLTCVGFLVCTKDVFWKHVCSAAMFDYDNNRLASHYNFRLQEFLHREFWEPEAAQRFKAPDLRPNLPMDERQRLTNEIGKKRSDFMLGRQDEVAEQRAAVVLRAAVDRGDWGTDNLLAALRAMTVPRELPAERPTTPAPASATEDSYWRAGERVIPTIKARFHKELTRDIHRLNPEWIKRRCEFLGEMAEVEDLAALRPLLSGNAVARAASRSACLRTAQRLNLDDCPPLDAPNADWSAWLTAVAPR